jgi:hypothetical protein
MNNETNEPQKTAAGMMRSMVNMAAKITTKHVPTLPELRERAMSAIARFKQSQRLPLLSQLTGKEQQLPDVPPDGLDIANFYRL